MRTHACGRFRRALDTYRTRGGVSTVDTSSSGIKFHLKLKPEQLQVPDVFTFNIRASDGSDREIIINRYENAGLAFERSHTILGLRE
eukprot:5420281-Prymnesium_polylepis.1